VYTHHRVIIKKAEAEEKELEFDMSQIKKQEAREETQDENLSTAKGKRGGGVGESEYDGTREMSVSCSVLQCVAVRCSVCCSVFQCVAACVAVCCSALQRVL